MPYSGLAPAMLPEFQAGDIEAEIELLTLDATEFRDDEVAQLVDEDHESQTDGDLENQHAVANYVQQQRNTSWRAQRSASSTCSRLGSGSKL